MIKFNIDIDKACKEITISRNKKPLQTSNTLPFGLIDLNWLKKHTIITKEVENKILEEKKKIENLIK